MCSFAIWAAAMASLVFWGLRLFGTALQAPAHTVAVSASQQARGDLAKVLGGGAAAATVAVAPPPAAASRFKLVGVTAPVQAGGNQGLALIAVDGKLPKAIAVGRTVVDGWVLQSVHRRGVKLTSNLGAESLELELPPLAVASRGSLPAIGQSIDGSLPNTTPNASGLPTAAGGPTPSGRAPLGAPPMSVQSSPRSPANLPSATVAPPSMTTPAPSSSLSSAGEAANASSSPPPVYVPPEERARSQAPSQ